MGSGSFVGVSAKQAGMPEAGTAGDPGWAGVRFVAKRPNRLLGPHHPRWYWAGV